MISKESILAKTHYGTGIYAHILRQFYPGETVMKIVGRDCGICKNPFADGSETLHVWTEKIHPEQKLSDEIARHKDQFDAIPEGDCFDFAKLYWQKDGQDLLIAINEDLYLHLEDGYSPYDRNAVPVKPLPSFSFFKAPVTNKTPHKSITLLDVWNYVTGHYAKAETEKLRSIDDKDARRKYKAAHFAYCTFSGVFSERANDKLVEHSGYLCLDFDHVQDLDALKQTLLNDPYFETQLMFRSPSGDGLKWIVKINIALMPHSDYFRSVSNYLVQTYGIEPDKSGKDVSRACFLPYDPEAYLDPEIR